MASIAALLLSLTSSLAKADSASKSCSPILWSVGEIDPAFGISRAQFRNAILAAIERWRETTGVTLFQEQRGGVW
jgi:hypothetical protein